MADTTAVKPPVTETALVPVERGNTGAGAEHVNLDPNKGRVSHWTSMPQDTMTDKVRVYRALQGDAKPLDSFIGKVIEVENVVVHPVDLTDPITGEVKTGARIVLIAPNGTMVGCVSNGVFDSIKKLGATFGPLPWTDGMLVKPAIVKTRRGFRTYQLELPTTDEVTEYTSAKELAAKKEKANANK